jgi:lipid-A-disaccharide synthase-like uncharacterized protein
MAEEGWWLLLGFAGQALFMGRFVVQWLASERRRRSIVPVAFWHLSIAGALVLLAYAVHRRDPVFAIGQGLGIVVYLRNLRLIGLRRRESKGIRRPGRAQGGESPSRPKSGSGRAR